MSNNKSSGKPRKTVTIDPLTRNLSTDEAYSLDKIDHHHILHPRKTNQWRPDSEGEWMTQFGRSKSASRDPYDPRERKEILWFTPQEKKLAQSRNSKNKKIAIIENQILKKKKNSKH